MQIITYKNFVFDYTGMTPDHHELDLMIDYMNNTFNECISSSFGDDIYSYIDQNGNIANDAHFECFIDSVLQDLKNYYHESKSFSEKYAGNLSFSLKVEENNSFNLLYTFRRDYDNRIMTVVSHDISDKYVSHLIFEQIREIAFNHKVKHLTRLILGSSLSVKDYLEQFSTKAYVSNMNIQEVVRLYHALEKNVTDHQCNFI